MDRALNKEILRLALPSILANITVPMVGIVDTSIAGHLSGGPGAAVCIGGISVGSMIFNLLYWNFAFLRTGTGGLTAQAFGRGDFKACAGMLIRSVGIALMMALMKIAREMHGAGKEDNMIDAAGYIGLAADMSNYNNKEDNND